YWALLNYPDAEKYDIEKIAANLRLAVSGGSAMPVEVMRAFGERFSVSILEGYGLSETSPVASFNRTDRPTKPGSVGLPVWGIKIRIVDIEGNDVPVGEMGEILIKGHNVMKGYYKRPEATAQTIENGWLHTGDIGTFDEEGYIYITDRVKDMIIRGGFNVYPREIEEVLMTHPAVSLAAVIGVPDESHGEEVKAFVILNSGAEESPDEIVAWCKENMAAYKYPRIIELRESLPMTATGKILKRELRE
ncbi:MAG: AMP-binding protein, partial [Candidatus Promineifilaceae bacterium]